MGLAAAHHAASAVRCGLVKGVVTFPAGEYRPLGHVEGNDQSLAVAGGRCALPDSQVAKVDVVVDRLEALDRVDAQRFTDGLAHQLAVPAGVLLGKQHVHVVAVSFAPVEPVEVLVAVPDSLTWS